jgi:hypothetical protein
LTEFVGPFTEPTPARERQQNNMINFIFSPNPTLTLVCVPSGDSALFSVDAVARFTGVHPDMLQYYWRVGLIEAARDGSSGELLLDESALREVRRIEYYRRHLGVGRRALPLLCDLQRKAERRHISLRFLEIRDFA